MIQYLDGAVSCLRRARIGGLSFRAARLASVMLGSVIVGAPAVAQAPQKMTVRAAFVPVATWLPAWVAKENRIFEKHGLDVSLTKVANVQLLPGTLGKQFDLAPSTPPDFLNAVASGIDLAAVAGGTAESSSNQSYLLIVPPTGINSPKDLVGKRIASPGIRSANHIAFLHWLKVHGVDASTMRTVEVPFTAMLDQLKSERVDAVEALQPFAGQMLAAGYKSLGSPLLSLADPVLFTFWIADRNWAVANQNAIRSWTAAVNEALVQIRADDAMARKVLAKYTGLPAAVVEQLPYPGFSFTLKPEQLDVWRNVLISQSRQHLKDMDINRLLVTAQ